MTLLQLWHRIRTHYEGDKSLHIFLQGYSGYKSQIQIKLFKRNDISFVSINRPNFDSGHLASWTDRKFNLCHSGLTSLTSNELCQDSRVLCSANILHWTSLYIGSTETTAVLSLQDPFGSWGPDTHEESGASSDNTASQLLLATHGIFLQGPQISLSSLDPELFLFPPQFPSEAFSFIKFCSPQRVLLFGRKKRKAGK